MIHEPSGTRIHPIGGGGGGGRVGGRVSGSRTAHIRTLCSARSERSADG